MQKKTDLYTILTIVVFVLFIFGLATASLFSPKKTFSSNENRYLATKPKLSLQTIFSDDDKINFAVNYEKYVTDQFVLRDEWILVKSMAELGFMKRELKDVYIGKDGYLIEEHSIDNAEQTEKNINRLAAFINQYAERLGEEHVKVMLIPSAAMILKDKLPPYAESYDEDILIHSLITLLNGDTFVDVRDNFLEHRDEYIYYKTDHHYTTLGAYYAYQVWANKTGRDVLSKDDFAVEQISDSFLGTIHSKINLPVKSDLMFTYTPKDLREVEIVYDMDESKKKDTLYETNHLETKDKYSTYLDGNHAFVSIKTGVQNGQKLLVIKDSFAHSFVPLVTSTFEEIYMTDFRYNRMPVSQIIEEYGITDILVLYNTMKFANDTNSINFTK